MNSVMLNECFKLAPCRYSIRNLSVSWEYSYEPIDTHVPSLEETISGLILVNLPALETFRLSIDLGEGIFGNDRVEEDVEALEMLEHIFFDNSDENYPSLKLLEINLQLGVWIDEDPFSAQDNDLRFEQVTEEYSSVFEDIEEAIPTLDFNFNADIRRVVNGRKPLL